MHMNTTKDQGPRINRVQYAYEYDQGPRTKNHQRVQHEFPKIDFCETDYRGQPDHFDKSTELLRR